MSDAQFRQLLERFERMERRLVQLDADAACIKDDLSDLKINFAHLCDRIDYKVERAELVSA